MAQHPPQRPRRAMPRLPLLRRLPLRPRHPWPARSDDQAGNSVSGGSVKRYLIAGLLVWLPLAVTIWVLQAALGLLDGVFGWFLNAGRAVLPSGAAPLID